jgi:tetratricopeptide (TPR) repeat protein
MSDSYESLIRQASALHALGSHDAALSLLDQAIAMDSDRVTAWLNSGIIHDAAGRPAKAIRALQRALERAPNHHGAWTNLAFITGRQDTEAGVMTWKAVLERFPDDGAALHNLGTLLNRLDRSLGVRTHSTSCSKQ